MGLLDSIVFLFAIVDAFGNLPLFIDLTSVMDRRMRQRAFDVAVLAGFSVVVLFSIAGRWVLGDVFRISVSEFQMAGGIVLVAFGVYGMVAVERPTPARGVGLEIAAVPMACPLLVGPGAIVTAMLIVQQQGISVALLAAVVVFTLARVIFWLAEPIQRLLGKLVLLILSRIMRIFIVAIGVHFVIAGIREVFHIG